MSKLAEYHVVLVIFENGSAQTVWVAAPSFTLDLTTEHRFALSGLDSDGRLVYRPEVPDA